MKSLSAFLVNPTDIRFDSQEEDEKIVFLLRRHVVTTIPWILVVVILAILPIFFFNFFDLTEFPAHFPLELFPMCATFWYLVTLGYTFESFLNWYFNVDIVTNKRIVDIEFWGILYRRVSELEYANVEDVTYAVHGLPATIFNYGNVFIQTAAEKREFEFKSIPNPDIVHDKITDLAHHA